MPMVPSKRKITPLNTSMMSIQALGQLADNEGNQFSMLMSIFKNQVPNRNVYQTHQTPSKSKRKIGNRTQVVFTSSTRQSSKHKNKEQKIRAFALKLSVMRTKIQARRNKISKLTAQIVEINKNRIQINKLKIEIYKSEQSVHEIKKLYQLAQQNVQDIKRLTEQLRNQKANLEKQVHQMAENLNNLDNKKKQAQINYQILQQKSANISYALQSQRKKNKNLVTKMNDLYSKLMDKSHVDKFTKQIFRIFIQLTQIRNTEYLNKHAVSTSSNHNSNQYSAMNIDHELKICFKNSNIFNKIPYQLVVLCEIYMFLKMNSKKINKKYLNKLSYFCKQIDNLFDFQNFEDMVREYFKRRLRKALKSDSNNQIKHEQNNQSQSLKLSFDKKINDNQQLSKNHNLVQSVQFSDYLPTQEPLKMIIKLSKTCECGAFLQKSVQSTEIIENIRIFFNVKLDQVQTGQYCCSRLYFYQRKEDQFSIVHEAGREQGLRFINNSNIQDDQDEMSKNNEDFQHKIRENSLHNTMFNKTNQTYKSLKKSSIDQQYYGTGIEDEQYER